MNLISLILAFSHAAYIVFGMAAAKVFMDKEETRWLIAGLFLVLPFALPCPLAAKSGMLTCFAAGVLIGAWHWRRKKNGNKTHVPPAGALIRLHIGPCSVRGVVFYADAEWILMDLNGTRLEFERWDSWELVTISPKTKIHHEGAINKTTICQHDHAWQDN